MKSKIPGWLISSVLFLIFLSGCATKPELKTDDINLEISPIAALQNFSDYKNQKVLWGGTIISTQNLKQGTMLEVLAYPMTKNFKPDTEKKPLGRFLAKHQEYLESVDYAPGRFISLTGVLSEVVESKIGEAEYHYPLVQIEQHYLWPLRGESDTFFHFGIGVMVHN